MEFCWPTSQARGIHAFFKPQFQIPPSPWSLPRPLNCPLSITCLTFCLIFLWACFFSQIINFLRAILIFLYTAILFSVFFQDGFLVIAFSTIGIYDGLEILLFAVKHTVEKFVFLNYLFLLVLFSLHRSNGRIWVRVWGCMKRNVLGTMYGSLTNLGNCYAVFENCLKMYQCLSFDIFNTEYCGSNFTGTGPSNPHKNPVGLML